MRIVTIINVKKKFYFFCDIMRLLGAQKTPTLTPQYEDVFR